MQRKFIFNLFLLVFLNLLVKPFYILGIDTEVLERVGQSDYGIYFALLNLAFMLNIFMDMGVVNFNTSNISKNQQLVSKHFSSIFGIRVMLSFFYLMFCLAAALFLNYSDQDLSLLLPICLNQIIVGFILYIRSNLSGLQLFEKDSIISVVDRSLLIVFCSIVLWTNWVDVEMSIRLFIYLQTLAYSLTLIIAFFILKPHLSNIRIKFNIPFNSMILKKSFPYALLILLMGFYYRTDAVMLERMLDNGAFEAGVYAQAFRFFEAGNMLAYLFGALLFPMFSKLLGNKEDVSELMNLAFRLISVGAIIAGFAGYFFAEEIMNLRFSSEIQASSDAFKYLMIGFTGICGTYVFGALLTANGNLKELNIMASIGVVLNIVLNLILIPTYKAMGAAIASMITQLAMALFQGALVYRKLHIWPGIKILLRMMVFTLIALFILEPLKFLSSHWWTQLLLYTGILTFTAFGIRLISFESTVQYFKLIRSQKT